MYAAYVGAAALRRRPVWPASPPAVSRKVWRKAQISLQAIWGIEYGTGVKRSDASAGRKEQAPPSTHPHRICTPQMRAPPRRGGSLLGWGFRQLYPAGVGGSRNSLYRQNEVSREVRAPSGATQNLPNGALLRGVCCGGARLMAHIALSTYAADSGADSRRLPLRSGFQPDLLRAAWRMRRFSLQLNRSRIQGRRQAARRSDRLDRPGAAAPRRRPVR